MTPGPRAARRSSSAPSARATSSTADPPSRSSATPAASSTRSRTASPSCWSTKRSRSEPGPIAPHEPHTLSASAQRALEDARAEARRLEHDADRRRAHRAGAAAGPTGRAQPMLRRLGLDPGPRARSGSRPAAGAAGRAAGAGELAYTSHAKRLIEAASKEAREAGTGLSAEHLLLAALLEPRGPLGGCWPTRASRPERVAGRDAAGARPACRLRRAGRPASPPRRARGGRRIPWRLLILLAVPVSIVLGYVVHAPAVVRSSSRPASACCRWPATWARPPSTWPIAPARRSAASSTPPSATPPS